MPAACSASLRDRARVAVGRVTAPLTNLQKSQRSDLTGARCSWSAGCRSSGGSCFHFSTSTEGALTRDAECAEGTTLADDRFRPSGLLRWRDRIGDRVIVRGRGVARLLPSEGDRTHSTPTTRRSAAIWSRLMGSPRVRRSVAMRIAHCNRFTVRARAAATRRAVSIGEGSSNAGGATAREYVAAPISPDPEADLTCLWRRVDPSPHAGRRRAFSTRADQRFASSFVTAFDFYVEVARRGKTCSAMLRKAATICSGDELGSVSSAGIASPDCFACSRMPLPAVLPRTLRAFPICTMSMWNCGTGSASTSGQLAGSRGLSGEQVIKGGGGGVAAGERVAETPCVAERGDHRCMSVLIVDHDPLVHPRGDDDRRHPVTRAVEFEVELPRWRGRVRRGHGSWGNVVIRSAGLVPADEEQRVVRVTSRPGTRPI